MQDQFHIIDLIEVPLQRALKGYALGYDIFSMVKIKTNKITYKNCGEKKKNTTEKESTNTNKRASDNMAPLRLIISFSRDSTF